MADSREPRLRLLSSAAPAPPLQYPTLPPLSASVEEWLSRSRLTDMSSSHHAECSSARSLSESWASMSVSDAHSEDGAPSEQTDIGSLIDPAGPDDVTSLDGRFSNSEVDGNDDGNGDDYDNDSDSESGISDSQHITGLFPRVEDAIDDSSLTTRAAFHRSTDSIEFTEPKIWPEVERVQLKHIIRTLEGMEADQLKWRFPYNLDDSVLVATVQQTMTKQSLDTDKPFRVLYIGAADFRNIILDKIGDALVSSSYGSFQSSSTESSRYHVVPTAFGAGATPNFAELLPIHVQLIVDECIGATTEPRMDKPNAVRLSFKNRPPCISSWTGSEYSISSSSEWTFPDVAIFFMSSRHDAGSMRTQSLAHAFMQRHGIPTMTISEEPLWSAAADPTPLNPHSLHLSLESQHSVTGDMMLLRRYPIDVKTFESITPSQLNRNLASLATLYPRKTSKAIEENEKIPERGLFFDTEKCPAGIFQLASSTRAHELTPALRLLTLTLVSAVALSLGYTGLKAILLLASQLIAQFATSNAVAPASVSVHSTAVVPVEGLRQTSLSLRSPSLRADGLSSNDPNHHTNAEELTGLSFLSLDQPSSQPDQFEIQTVGDFHVVIKPPHGFPSGKKRPRFEVSVSRRGKILPYELSKLFEGVYSLKLDREDAQGLVNITVSSPKPPLNQVTQVDFGTPWLKISNWKRAAQILSSQLVKDFGTAQAGVSETYGRLCTDLQELMGDVVKKSHFIRQEAELLRRDSAQITRETRDAILSSSKQLSKVIKHTALQQFSTASSILQGHVDRLNEETKEILSDTWKKIEVTDLGQGTGQSPSPNEA
ncbi:hypothetical protein MAP00_002021 [Monascus purpureus]|nr:hypothetical protein MAP00_002021 [Monascus purpureus]